MNDTAVPPLDGLRVLESSDRVGAAAGRLLADLGADVVGVRSAGARTQDRADLGDLGDLVDSANKSQWHLDPADADDVARWREAATRADVVILDTETARILTPEWLARAAPGAVVVVSTPFGRTGPRARWTATDRTLTALSGALSRSGRPGGVPLLPPVGIAQATAAAQLAWTVVSALHQRALDGRGRLIDLSHHEAVVTGLDPAFGVQGSAAAGRSGTVRRDRPPADSYPVFACADGHVRLCLLSRRQWRGMFAWLGSPEEFADPRFDSISERVRAADRLDPVLAAHFASRPAAVLVEEAASHGVPLAQVLTLRDTLETDHFRIAGTIRRVRLADDLEVDLPVGAIDLDGERLGFRAAARPVDAPDWSAPAPSLAEPQTPSPDQLAGLPFSGLRVLDLGVIVFGAEIGRCFADFGADVVKVESLAFPDGLRQTRGGEEMNASFAWGQRNKRSLGLDLRSPEGRDLFLDLARSADVVLSNFKPGTLASLGIGEEVLRPLNPGIVIMESAAFSARGPWARRLGYGPLVRAACGISSLWRYGPDDVDPDSCWDGVTVFPDHVAAKIGAVAIAATLLRRARTGVGGRLELAQSDVVLTQLAAAVAAESRRPGSTAAAGNAVPGGVGGVLACAGDDEWCVVDPDDTHLPALAALLGAGEDRGELQDALRTWCASRTPAEAMEQLQQVGVPAAAMLRLPELLDDPQLQHRGTYTRLTHPLLDHDLPTEDPGAAFDQWAPVPLNPAPRVGEHTRDVVREWLGLDDETVTALLARGVLHTGAPAVDLHPARA